MKTEITCFVGVIGSGKDFHAGKLQEQGYQRIDFKDELIRMVSDIVGFDVSKEYDWFKDAIVGIRDPGNPLVQGMHRAWMKELLNSHPNIMTGRQLLQRVGTDAIRSRHPDYWVDCFKREVADATAQGKKVVNADCRFENEVLAVVSIDEDAKFIFCNYRSPRYNPYATHQSEQMAQALLRAGKMDGDEMTANEVLAAITAGQETKHEAKIV